MAESYKDITGPVTVLTTLDVREERADDVAKYLAKIMSSQVQDAKQGKLPGYEAMECTRYGNKIVIWERYTDAAACERLLPANYAKHKNASLSDASFEPPSMLFFPSDGLGVPKFTATSSQ